MSALPSVVSPALNLALSPALIPVLSPVLFRVFPSVPVQKPPPPKKIIRKLPKNRLSIMPVDDPNEKKF